MIRRGSRTLRRAAIALLSIIVLLALTLPVAWALDQPTKEEGTPKATGADASSSPAGIMGVYVTSLRDFDTVGDSFGIDFWVWSVHPSGDNPLENVEFVNAKQLETRLDETARRGDREWSRLKARATVLHNWDVSNFPFDQQTLTMDLGIADSDAAVYRVDRAGSGYRKDIAPNGWRITNLDVERRNVENATNLGDPVFSGRSSQEHIFVTVALERDSIVGFFKLVAGVYAAIAIALLSFLMAPDQPPIFSGRMTVLVGVLFATVVSMQVSNSILGSLEGVSLVDKIHIVALAYIFAAAFVAVISRRDFDSGHKDRAVRRDMVSLYVFGGSFLIINVLLILLAAAAS